MNVFCRQAQGGKAMGWSELSAYIRRASPDVRELSAEAFTDPEGAETIGRILATAGLAVSFSAMIPCGLGQFS